MKELILSAFSMASAALFAAPTVESVIIRQQWPWSSDIKVEYRLSGLDGAVDLKVEASRNGTAIDDALLQSALSGERYLIRENIGSFIIDPVKLFGTANVRIEDFNVKLTASPSSADSQEVLYKIFDLTTGGCEDVTRGALLNGDYGAVETDFAKLGEAFGVKGFNTSLPAKDIVIWTGVTNDAVYKTSKLVMRKVPAKGKSFWMGSGEGELWPTDAATKPYRQVSFTNDYFVAVFELTDGQFQCIITNTPTSTLTIASSDKMRFLNADWRYVRPVNVPDYVLRSSMAAWPEPSAAGVFADNRSSLVGNLRLLTGNHKFDLPTEAVWEYACRAGTETTFNCGLDTNDESVQSKLARSSLNSNMNSSNYQDGTALATWTPADGGTAVVGSYPPNAWGLYDMHGNLLESCLDHFIADPTTLPYYSSVDPWGPLKEDATSPSTAPASNIHVGRGGAYWYNAAYFRSAYRYQLNTNIGNCPYMGVRLCLRAD